MTDPWSTGRRADVGDLLAQVKDHDDVARLIEAMQADLQGHPGEWENPDLNRYLDALAAVIGSLDSLFANRGEDMPEQPTWQLVAEVLLTATEYE